MRKSWKRNLRHSDVNGRKRLNELSLTVAHHEIHPLWSRPLHLAVKALQVHCFWKLRTLLIQHHLLRRKRYYFDSFYFDSFWWGYIDPMYIFLPDYFYKIARSFFCLLSFSSSSPLSSSSSFFIIVIMYTLTLQFCWSTEKIPLEKFTASIQGSQGSGHLSNLKDSS